MKDNATPGLPEEIKMQERLVGLNLNELLEVRRKLQVLGLDLCDILEFMDRNEVQLFAELRSRIKYLEAKLQAVHKASVV